jgi:cytoskeleton protein RodZ
VNEQAGRQVDAFTTPGSLLKAARLAEGMSEREAADRLNLMPDYVGIIERDDYDALRSPAFARGYVRAYGRLLGLEEQPLLELFDELGGAQVEAPGRIETRPMQLQATGVGVVIGLAVLLLLVVLLWWWKGVPGERGEAGSSAQWQSPGGIAAPLGGTGEQE